MTASKFRLTLLSSAPLLGLTLGIAAVGCIGMTPTESEHAEAESGSYGDSEQAESDGPAHVSMPRNSTAGRDDRRAPIVQVASSGNVVFATVYGYPIYPEGDAAKGILAMRRDNWSSMKKTERPDDSGVLHEIEEYGDLGCRIDGVRENANKFVPLTLSCELPAPKGLGGAKRPVIGQLGVGAKAEQLLKDKSVEEVFLGGFHLKSDDFEAGSGYGFFNTTHGQLAFGFSKKKLQRFVYYFDPDVKGWQNPTLWVKP